MVVPPQILRGIAENTSLTTDQQDAAQRTLELDEKRREKQEKMPPSSASPVPRPSKMAMRKLLDFYDPAVKGQDRRGRTLDQILSWPDVHLEDAHDYIQLIFPLPEGSIFSDLAPVIDEEMFVYFRQNTDLKSNLRRSLERMLAFYGFVTTPDLQGEESDITVTEAENPRENFGRWVKRMDHNHLRITRIIRSLRVLGLEKEARAFYNALIAVADKYGRIGDSTLGFWTRAMELPLHQAPDGELVKWLEKYETGMEDHADGPKKTSVDKDLEPGLEAQD